jgi:hypothetical protein
VVEVVSRPQELRLVLVVLVEVVLEVQLLAHLETRVLPIQVVGVGVVLEVLTEPTAALVWSSSKCQIPLLQPSQAV